MVEDQCKVINYSTVDDFYKNAVLGFMKDTKEWSFRQVSDYTTELFKFVGYNLSVWSVYKTESNNLVLWNQWSDRDKCYYEIKREGNKYEIGQKYTVFNSTFEYLVQNFNHKYDRDKFTTVDKSGIHKMQLKDKKKLAKFIRETLQEQLRSDSSGTNSCTLLTFNKLKNVYTLFHGNRKDQQLSVIESNQIGESMKQA